jgi:hypothetical protein
MTTRKKPAKPAITGGSKDDNTAAEKRTRDRPTAKQQLDESLARERARPRAGSDD